ncbi:hypothetical protein Vau01_069300 [Virgisporangium aurantiacum]|uniref:Uncharacterized protein n=1 Tax=Virgisporangium aurantiacum TaxID=175570 RepID=A0A8J3Z8P0_9ACTN|nr:hypothetical protein Vau01_069300 [Virgisporangium aurantiacum]
MASVTVAANGGAVSLGLGLGAVEVGAVAAGADVVPAIVGGLAPSVQATVSNIDDAMSMPATPRARRFE